MMAGIRGKNTKPELIVRRGLFARGFRYRLHVRELPGSPDLVFPGRRSVILVHGCFWHGHSCHLFKWPKSNKTFWKRKINQNRQVDRRSRRQLLGDGWRVLTVWECALKGPGRRIQEDLLRRLARWLDSTVKTDQVTGRIHVGQVGKVQ